MGGQSVVVDHAQHSVTDAKLVKLSPNCEVMMFRSRPTADSATSTVHPITMDFAPFRMTTCTLIHFGGIERGVIIVGRTA